MNKLYTSFLFALCVFSFHNCRAQVNSNQGNLFPLIESNDVWPFEFPKGIVRDMKVLNDTLYIVGAFETFNGEDLNSVFKWDGFQIESMNADFDYNLDAFSETFGGHCIASFQNTIVMAARDLGDSTRVYQYDGLNWNPLGGSLGLALINDMIEWNGNLYVATSNNTLFNGSTAVLKLNENLQWESMALPNASAGSNFNIDDLELHNGVLYAFGSITSFGGGGVGWYNSGEGFLELLFPELATFRPRDATVIDGELYLMGFFNEVENTEFLRPLIRLENFTPEILGPRIAPATIEGYFKLNNQLYLSIFDFSQITRIIDEDSRERAVSNRYTPHPRKLYVKPVVYKGQAFLPLYVGDNVHGFYTSIQTFAPMGIEDLSNSSQSITKSNFNSILDLGYESSFSSLTESAFNHLGLNAAPLFTSGFMMVGKADGLTYLNASNYRPEPSNWFPGPFTENYTSETYHRYNRVWKVKQADIDAHISGFGQPGYSIPSSIAEWPGNGNFGEGESHMLAPFFDVNQNTLYEPQLGDYPIIRGKEAMFWVQHAKPGITFEQPLEVDLHVMAYIEEDEGLNDLALFFHTVVINRSSVTFDSLRVGLFNDFDLGNPTDDLVGCDSLLAVSYVYNGDDLDEAGPLQHYESQVPAFGCVFLSENMESNSYWNSGTNPVNGNPETVEDFYNYMNGRYKTGSLTIEGQASAPTGPMMFQDSPCGEGTENEIDLGNLPGDRRLMSAGEVHTLQPNESFCFDFAYYFKPKTGDHIETLCAFLEDIPAIHSFYQDKNYSCAYVNNIEEEEVESRLRVFPNPCGDIVNLDLTSISSSQQIQLRIIDAQGRVMMTELINQPNQLLSIDTSKLSAGAYSIVLNTDKEQLTQLLVKE